MISIKFEGLGYLERVHQDYIKSMRRAVFRALKEVSAIFQADLEKMISYETYTLEELAAMGHPLAAERNIIPAWDISPTAVHRRGGEIWESLKTYEDFEHMIIDVGWKGNYPAVVKYIAEGTKYMLGRDVLRAIFKQKNYQKLFAEALDRQLSGEHSRG